MVFFKKFSHSLPSRVLIFCIILGTTWLYFVSQNYIGSVPAPRCEINDLLEVWTASWNGYLRMHSGAADALLVLRAFLGDMTILFLLVVSLKQCSLRPSLPLFFFLVLRQILQLSVSLPIAPGMIWHDPGFPSLFSIYGINSDLYFSAYVGIGILGAIELSRFRNRWLTACGFAAVVFQALANIALRAHYTTDTYTSIVTAIAIYLLTSRFSQQIDRFMKKWGRKGPTILAVLIFLSIGGFFATQSIIGQKEIPTCGIFDWFHDLSFPLNHFLQVHPCFSDGVLIAMNILLDALTVFLMGIAIWKRDIRPFLGLTLFMILRQSLQMLVALPIPPLAIWYYPGCPSLLQTYEITNDLYFSGHTGVSFLAALEIARIGKRWLTTVGFAIFGGELIGILVLRMHYTMDVYTAIMTVFCVTALASRWAPAINRILGSVRFFSRH